MEISSLFNPASSRFDACKKFREELSAWQRTLTIFVTIFATLFSAPLLGIGGVAAFRLMVGKYTFRQINPDNDNTTGGVDEIAKRVLIPPKEKEEEVSVEPAPASTMSSLVLSEDESSDEIGEIADEPTQQPQFQFEKTLESILKALRLLREELQEPADYQRVLDKLFEQKETFKSTRSQFNKQGEQTEGDFEILAGNACEVLTNEIVDCFAACVEILEENHPDVKRLFRSILFAQVDSLETYCEKYCHGMDATQARALGEFGGKLLKQIFTGAVTSVDEDSRLAEQQISYLIWFLMTQAIDSKQGFSEGTFVIEDTEDGRLFAFLRSFEKVYERPSSHFKGRSNDIHFGIDIFPESVGEKFALPARKRTLLFDRIQKKHDDLNASLLYIKPENYGACWETSRKDFLMHAWEFVEAQLRKLSEGGDDLPDFRKERVPADILKAFKDIFPEDGEKLALAKVWGIAYMQSQVELLTSPHDENEEIGVFNELIQGYDHLEERTGREVFLTF